MGSSRFTRTVAVGLLTGAAIVGLSATAGAASAAPQARHPLDGSTPRWLNKAHDLGASQSSQQVNFGVLLGMRDQSGAIATLQAISDPASPSYGHWLSNATFDARYAPAGASVAAVQNWLRSEGFRVTNTLPSGMYVEASGSVAQVQSIFGTRLHDYTYLGKDVRANATQLSLPDNTPAAVVSAISGVIGVDQGTALKQIADTEPGPPPGARYGVQPCSAYYAQKVASDKPTAYGKHQPYAVCGYAPQQLQSAYGESALLRAGADGRGVTVAITDAYAAPTIYADAQTYNRVHNQPLFTPGQFSQITPGPNGFGQEKLCGPQGWYGEETLDVEAVHTMAPGAKIVYVGAPDCLSGLDNAWASTIDNHVADVITNSWNSGTDDITLLGTAYVTFYQQFSLEAALTGITVNFSSGDSGDHTAGGTNLSAKTVEFPADLPYVTGVGGTSVLIGRQGQWLEEYGWQNAYSKLTNGAWTPAPPGTYNSGGGGGTSQLFTQPFYQVGKVPASISEYYGKTPMRAVPDIAMDADPNTGFLVGETQVFPNGTYWDQYRIGGTSLSSPLLAGVVAVADQLHRHPLGFINPLYYRLLGTPALHDIVAPTSPVAQVRTDYVNLLNNSQGKFYRLQTIDVQSSTLHDTPGYDDETGVGTPHGPLFFLAALRLRAGPEGRASAGARHRRILEAGSGGAIW
ncbi:MAG: S8/S53 family peptidase [Actinobacteria bacterium]|nr:S8/S53 family peptidase [Actinomycetota bacterium]